MADWDLLLTDANIATMREGRAPYGAIEGGAVAIANGKIAWLGPAGDAPAGVADETRSLEGRWITPALIDCHTHLVFGGDRAAEFEQRQQGASYEDIARAGGGILSTVHATRSEAEETLLASATKRAKALLRDGVATIEIKSGYGLDMDSELKSLRVARNIETGQTIRTTLLAAHTVPPEYKDRPDDYVDLICDAILPAAAEQRLADAVDAYCESIAFNSEQVARVFSRARELGLPVKLHADQLSDGHGAELAAYFGATSADHLEFTSAHGIAAMRDAGTIAVLLPGAFVTLGETQQPPIETMRTNGVPIAVATDCNPGTSPLLSLREAMALACRVFSLAPEEALAGATRVAAAALRLAHDRGTLEVGKRADIAIWDIDHPRDLCYWLGTHPLADLLINGRTANLA
ncbi:MAG: imidazolonepropionase [Woeseiaceae bacterium]